MQKSFVCVLVVLSLLVLPSRAESPMPVYCGPYPSNISAIGMDFIKQHERFHETPYPDAGGWAVGYGMHTWKGTPVTAEYPVRITKRDADVEFRRQLTRFERIVRRSVCATLSQHEFDSLVSVAYNLGRVNTTIIERFGAGELPTLPDFLSTATVNRRPSAGLVTRRSNEFAMFRGDFHH